MKIFWRILSYIKPFSGKLLAHIMTMIIGISLIGISIAFMESILKILFSSDTTSTIVSLQNTEFSFLSKINEILVEIIEADSKVAGLTYAIFFIIGLYIFGNLFKYVSQLLMNSIRTKIIQNIRKEVFIKTNKLQVSYFEGERKGDIITRFTADMVNIEQSILTTLESLIRDPYTIILFIVLMISASPALTLYIFILIPPMAIIVTFIGKSLRKNSMRSQEELGKISNVIDEFTAGIRIIKAFNAEKFVSKIFDKHNNTYRKESKHVLNKNRAIPIISESLGIITVGVFLYFSGRLVFEGKLNSELIFVFVLFLQQITQPAKKISQAFGNIMKGAASGERVFQLLDAPVAIKDKDDAIDLKSFEKSIKFNDVSFAYIEDRVLKNINLEIPKGQLYALVGQSGSGKTTLAELILRFYDVKSGSICLDEKNIKNISLYSLRNQMAVVTQDPILFNDSIFNNIAFGIEEINEEKVIEAAKAANAHEFILETENGYQTVIGDRGSLLSGGQRQRLSIARAILRNPPILILDEATSALDTASEKIVQDALENLMQNRTSIVIAHRLSTIQNADKIIVLDKGKIIETGKHNELINQNGAYKKLYELQQLSNEAN